MSMHYLGPRVDIHSGGADLIFPHHTCEIAQSEHYSGVSPFVRYWFHIAMVRLAGEKMSKSLGNMLFVSDLLKTFSANAIRYYLLSHKYRDPWDADDAEAELRSAAASLTRWQSALAAPNGNGAELDPMPYEGLFGGAMDDDFDTPRAIRHLDELVDAILAAAQAGHHVATAQQAVRMLAGVLGLQLEADS